MPDSYLTDQELTKKTTSKERIARAGLSGALTGGVFGGISSLMSGQGKAKAIKDALLGAALGGTTAGGAIAGGEALLGEPDEGETNVYTKRGAAGGAAIGALGGLGAAALLRPQLAMALRKYGSLGEKAGQSLKVSNPILKDIQSMLGSQDPAKRALAYGGLIAGPAAGGAFFGADEGMGLDVLETEMQSRAKKKQREQMLQRLMAQYD